MHLASPRNGVEAVLTSVLQLFQALGVEATDRHFLVNCVELRLQLAKLRIEFLVALGLGVELHQVREPLVVGRDWWPLGYLTNLVDP